MWIINKFFKKDIVPDDDTALDMGPLPTFNCFNNDEVVECKRCVSACPNGANICINTEKGEQIVHIADRCTQCGECTKVCPYADSPSETKFTLYSSEEQMSRLPNSGFVLLGEGRFKLRMGSLLKRAVLAELPATISGVISATCQKLELSPGTPPEGYTPRPVTRGINRDIEDK